MSAVGTRQGALGLAEAVHRAAKLFTGVSRACFLLQALENLLRLPKHLDLFGGSTALDVRHLASKSGCDNGHADDAGCHE